VTRLTRDDLAANPRLRAAVTAALAADVARDAQVARRSRATPPARTRPDLPVPAGRAGNTYRCAACQMLHPSYAAAERHADTHNDGCGARIELEL